MPAAPLSLLGENNEVDPAAVQVVVAVAVANVAVVGAAVGVKVAAAVATVAAAVVATVVVVVVAAGFAVRVVVAPPTPRGWIRSNCYWLPAQLRDEVVEPRGERAQSGEQRLGHGLVRLLMRELVRTHLPFTQQGRHT